MTMLAENRYDSLIAYYAERSGRDPRQIKRQIRRESAFNPDAVSPAGCVGLAQFGTLTWSQWWDGDGDLEPPPVGTKKLLDRRDPEDAIMAMCAYMVALEKRFSRLGYALAGYNMGPTALARHLERLPAEERLARWMEGLPKETRDYVVFCLGFDAEALVC